ncbi:MAG: hypothetical protein HYZ84_00355 [Candidatus Omnitrophica bacterium]|nr:hypothetical protein [Candidatus Omnitrophota bacterium]
MLDMAQMYLRAILNERSWSWALIGLVYVVGAYTIRSWFMKPLVRRARELDKPLWHKIKGAYLQHSLLGWLFFLLPLFISIVLWYREAFAPITIKDIAAILGALVSFLLSIFCHLQAFGIATIEVLRQTAKTQSEKIF